MADYTATGVTVEDHVMAALRPRLRELPHAWGVPMLATSAQLGRMPHGCAVSIAGLVIARQRPGTAKGIVFLLFEDEWGTVNLIVPADVYDRYRQLVRTEPLLLASGRLERPPAGGGVINVLVRQLRTLDLPAGAFQGDSRQASGAEVDAPPAGVLELPGIAPAAPAAPGRPAAPGVSRPAASHVRIAADGEAADGPHEAAGGIAASMRAAAPAVQSFASGRRR